MISSAGTSQTAYGFTGEQHSADTQLLYLRARYYNPADGRFQSRDTRSGDGMRPMSMNRWMYVEGNPVNYSDHTGHYSETIDWCQMMPTKGLYAYCKLKKYGLEPMYPFDPGKYVNGGIGCYSGPTKYRAPGYLEGLEVHKAGLPLGATGGLEVVYDFAAMQRSGFQFIGVTASDGIIGLGASFYVGKAMGFKTDADISDSYRGVSFSVQGGVSFDLGIGAAVGRGFFVSNDDIMLWGKTLYVGIGVSGDLVEGIDLSGSWASYSPNTVTTKYDANRDGIVENKQQLYEDISLGRGSPLHFFDFINPGTILSRLYGRLLAEKYVKVYEDLWNEGY